MTTSDEYSARIEITFSYAAQNYVSGLNILFIVNINGSHALRGGVMTPYSQMTWSYDCLWQSLSRHNIDEVLYIFLFPLYKSYKTPCLPDHSISSTATR